MNASGGIQQLAWDSAQFGIRVGTIDLDQVGALEALDRDAAHFALVYGRTQRAVALDDSVLERLNGAVADRRVSFRHDLTGPVRPKPDLRGEVQSVREADALAEPLVTLAPQAAKYSRFNSDPNFPRAWTEALYRVWMENSLTRERADEVLAYVEGGRALGLYTVRIVEGIANLELFAVAEAARRRGIGGLLLSAGLDWARQAGVEGASVTTQEENPACTLYRTFGYTEFAHESIYHLWPAGAPAESTTTD